MGDWEGENNWYGGRVQQRLRLFKHSSGGPGLRYGIKIEKLEKRRSNGIARQVSSRGIQAMSIPDDLIRKERDQIQAFLLQNFVLCGRVYRPFSSKEGKVYLIETDQNYERGSNFECQGDQYRMSFRHFLAWCNPLCLNPRQVLVLFISCRVFKN